MSSLLRSLSDKYPWEIYKALYPPSYGLNSTKTVLPYGWLQHYITTMVDMPLNKEIKPITNNYKIIQRHMAYIFIIFYLSENLKKVRYIITNEIKHSDSISPFMLVYWDIFNWNIINSWPLTCEYGTRPFFKWVQTQSRCPDPPGGHKNASGFVGITLKGRFRHQTINLALPSWVRA